MTSALDACVRDGQRWSIAYSAGVGILMYNKTMLADAGITEIPKTMDEVLEVAAKVNDPANGKYGLSFRGGQERGISLPWLVNWLYEAATGIRGRGQHRHLDTDAGQGPLEQLVNMYDYAPEGIDSYAYQEAWKGHAQGYAAMFVDAATLAVNLLDRRRPSSTTSSASARWTEPIPGATAGRSPSAAGPSRRLVLGAHQVRHQL